MLIHVRDIEYDTHLDDIDEYSDEEFAELEENIQNLPCEMLVEIDNDWCDHWNDLDFDFVVDKALDIVSEETGWCIAGSTLEVYPDTAPPILT